MKITHIIAPFLFLGILANGIAQTNSSLWNSSIKSELTAQVEELDLPQNLNTYQMQPALLQNLLQQTPKREIAASSTVIVPFPVGNGLTEDFAIFEASNFHPLLAVKYPTIKSYVGISTSSSKIIRFSLSSQKGLSATIISADRKTIFIESISTDFLTYAVYSRNADEAKKYAFACLTDDIPLDMKTLKQSNNKDANDQLLRTFRIAISATGEYTTYHGGTKALAMAAINATITRVNSVYETDFGITLQLIPNNDDVVYTNAATDPYTNNLNTQLQNTLNSVIQSANYDVGHLFQQGGNNGNAGCIGCICGTSKGSGFSSHTTPQGDFFDIDYVAHEIGHQFGANHSWTHGGSEGSGAQMEPGSGSTIMGYAGITGASDVQAHSDDYFHFFNIQQVTSNVASKNCYISTPIVNTPPTANAGADYTIPKGTAFILEGSGADPDADSLSFCWEQANVGFNSQTSVSATSTGSPAFRSFAPTITPNRYMPKLANVVAGNLTTQWETVANVGRTMNFSLTVRDNLSGGGQNKIDQMVVIVDANSGPFSVTSQNTAVTWNEGSTETITWNVAGTNAGVVNTPNVDIFLSQDGGFTYPITIATGVPNNGIANITVPLGSATTMARVMVRGAGNIFYALNSSNFTIQASEFVMNFAPGAATNAVCAPGTATYNFTYNTFLGFNDVTTFSASGNPAGTTVSFTPTTAQANGTNVAMVISGITSAMVGNYTITITGTAASTTKSTNVILNVFSNTFNAITLLSPVNGATNISGPHTFTWQADVNATSYDIEIATDNAFTNIIENVTGITNTSYTSSSLLSDTEYFWRIKPVNQCGSGGFSSVFSVTTANCFTIMSTNVPVTIPTTVSTVTSTINVTNTGTINDVNVVDLIGNHSWINDLIVELESPQGTKITLWDQICGNEDNFDVNFDDAATPGALPCPPVGGGTYQPQGSLAAFNGQNPQGTWILSIQDVFNQDGGALTSWGLNICLNSTVSSLNDLDNLSTIKAFPNPATHALTLIGLNIEKTTSFTITDITGKVVLTPRNQASIQQKIDISSLANGIYFLKVNSNNAEKTIKFVKQ